MHELLVADAFRPGPVCILNLPMAEYSLGHELMLLRRRNALLVLTGQEFSALDYWKQIFSIREAAWLCSDPFSERERCERVAPFMWRFRWNEWKRKRWVNRLSSLQPEDYAVAEAELRNYLRSARPHIPTAGKHAVAALYGDEPSSRGRCFGQPLVLSLYNFVITLPATERPANAWDFPFARAMWLMYARLESDGAFRMENAEEREEQSVYDEAEREARESGSENPKEKAAAGLATQPPDLGGEESTAHSPKSKVETDEGGGA